MAPAVRYQSAIEQLGPLLAESRREGLSFDHAWDRAVRPNARLILTSTPSPPAGCIRWPSDSATRIVERTALLSTRSEWRRAFERRPPTTRESAIPRLLELLPVLVAASERGGRPALPTPSAQVPRPAAERLAMIEAFLRAHPGSTAAEIVVAGASRRTVWDLLQAHPERFTSVGAGRELRWTVVEELPETTVLRAA